MKLVVEPSGELIGLDGEQETTGLKVRIILSDRCERVLKFSESFLENQSSCLACEAVVKQIAQAMSDFELWQRMQQ